MRRLDEPCPTPGRNGRHEVYLVALGALAGSPWCKSCGATDAPALPRLALKEDRTLAQRQADGDAEQHDRELEPTDDTIASIQHEVAMSRAKREEREEPLDRHVVRRQVMACLTALRPTAAEWLIVAALATEAYEAEKERER